MSPILDCGHTLVGGKKVVQVVCENKGGDGKFCIMRKSCWPTTSFEVRMLMEMEIHEPANEKFCKRTMGKLEKKGTKKLKLKNNNL